RMIVHNLVSCITACSIFFFSSRRRHTRFSRDWSSDVCSSDLNGKDVAGYITELQGLSPDEFVKEVWRERLRELPLEFKMWDDCLRTRMFPVISASEKGRIDFVPLIGAQSGSGATFKESDLLWPISMDELQRNPELTPTEGYQY